MDLRFNLKTLLLIEIDGEEMSTEGDELYIDGVHGPSILDQMMRQYEEIGIGVRTSALRIADLVFGAGQSIDKATARCIAQEMAMLARDLAMLARDMLGEETKEWGKETLDRLRTIQNTDPDFAEAAE
jgi:hypothetical protein